MKEKKIVTTDLNDFSCKELKKLEKLLTALCEQGLPSDFYNDEVVPTLNLNSGYVFLTNSDYQVAMLDRDGKLKSFYYLSYHGYEGFLDDLIQMYDDEEILEEDFEELADICENNGLFEKAKEIRSKITD